MLSRARANEKIEFVVNAVVDEVVGDHADVVLVPARGLGFSGIVGRPSLGCLADGDDTVPRHHEVDLLVKDSVFLWDGNGDEEDSEDVVAVPLELGARLVVVLRRRAELLQRLVMNLRR